MRKDVLLRIRRTVWRIRHIVWRIRRPVCRLWYIHCCVWRIWRMWHILRSVWCIHRTSRIRRAVWHTKMYCVTHTTYSVTYTTYCLTHLFTAGTVNKNSSSNFAVIEKCGQLKKNKKVSYIPTVQVWIPVKSTLMFAVKLLSCLRDL